MAVAAETTTVDLADHRLAARNAMVLAVTQDADGHRTIYEMRGNQYWIPIGSEWHPVPPDAVIHGARSPFGDAVVWYRPQFNFEVPTGDWEIVCFVPSDDV